MRKLALSDSLRAFLRLAPALFVLQHGAAAATTTTFFNAAQVATPVSSGVTSDTISSEGYVFTYTRDKLFTGGVGLTEPIGRYVRVPWPTGIEAQAVTTGPNLSGGRITIRRADGLVFDIKAFTAKLLCNTAATGAAFEVMPSLNGQDVFNDPFYFDASGYYGGSFPYALPATAPLAGYDKYTIGLFCDFALTALSFESAGPPPPDTPTETPTQTPTDTPPLAATQTPTDTPPLAATPTPTDTQLSAPTATPSVLVAPTATPIDHFACYKVTALRAPSGQAPFPRFTPRKADVVEDAFSGSTAGDQHKVDVTKVIDLCHPADVDAGDPTAPMHAAHLSAYVVKLTKTTPAQPKFTKSVHTVQNRLGRLKLTAVGGASILLPTAVTLGTGGSAALGSSGLDHFKCYRVVVARAPSGQPPFPKFTPTSVSVSDEFGGPLLVTLKRPTKLCLPASLNVGDPTAAAHEQHLVCYAARRSVTTPPQPKFAPMALSTNSEFGDAVQRAVKLDELCLPSARLD